MGLVPRFIGVITSPRATFQAVVAHPRWFGMLALVTLIVAVGSALPLMTPEGQQAAVDRDVQFMQGFGQQVNDEMYAQMQQRARFGAYVAAGFSFVMIPLFSVIMAGILFGVFTMLGGQATFKQVFAVYVHAGAVGALGQLFTGPLNYLRGSVSSATNLAVALPMIDEQSYLGRLFGMIDFFIIWGLIVTAIGFGVLYRRRTQPIALTFFAIYAVIILAAAAVMSAFGGS
jgi:hypothetical protein